MEKRLSPKIFLLTLLLISIFSVSRAARIADDSFITVKKQSFSNEASAGRNIALAGLVVNANTLLPVDSANIYDGENNMLGTTDKNGYFKVSIKYIMSGNIHFKLKIIKPGYQAFLQKEHWGDLSGNIKNILYFGLKESKSKFKAFSTSTNVLQNGHDLSYDNVFSNFNKVRAEKIFNNQLESAKAGNDKVFIQVEGNFYLVNKSGWIRVNSEKAMVSINDEKQLPAHELNAVTKRKQIKWMTPVQGKEEAFAIYTN